MRTTKFLSVSCLLVMLVYAVPGYAPPPGSCTPWPECKDGSGDPPSGGIANNDTDARWADTSLISELAARGCFLESAQNNGEGGHYICDLGTAINFALPPGQEINKKGNPINPSHALCGSMGSISMTPTHYPYSWAGDCTDAVNGCPVRVRNWIFEDISRPSGTGLIILDGFTRVFGTSNANPFADNLPGMQMDEVVITFKGDGTNKNEAVCRWSADDGNLSSGDVEFDSIPN